MSNIDDITHETLTVDHIEFIELESIRDEDTATAAMCRIARGVYAGSGASERAIRLAREYIAEVLRERLAELRGERR